jgi:cytochrome c553
LFRGRISGEFRITNGEYFFAVMNKADMPDKRHTSEGEAMTAATGRRLLTLLLSGFIIGSAFAQTPAPPPAFAAPDLTAGGVRSLAANCAACHGTNGNSAGGAYPGLAGMNREYFLIQVKAFREGKREATVMHQLSKGYSDAEMAALADYFAAQKK